MIYEIFRVFGILIGYPVQWLLFKRRTFYEGEKNKNHKKGAKLIISNHFSLFDYMLTTFVVFPRKLNGVTSEQPFKLKIARFGMKFFGAIQANRETKSMSFITESVNVLKKGQIVQIFPEGRNTPDGKIHEFKAGYLMIAHQAKVPIVPIVTDGNYGLFKRASIIIGKEIYLSELIESTDVFPPSDQLRKANEVIFNKVLELRKRLEELKKEKGKRRKKQ